MTDPDPWCRASLLPAAVRVLAAALVALEAAHAALGDGAVAWVGVHALAPVWRLLALPVLVGAVLARRPLPGAWALLVLGLAVGARWRPLGAPGDGVVLVTANLFVGNPDPAASVRALLAAVPDDTVLIALQEVTDAAATALSDPEVQASWPHQRVLAQADPFGVALLSRIPLGEAVVHEVGGSPLLLAPVDGLPGVARVATVHLDAPDRVAGIPRWTQGLADLEARLRQDPDLAVLADLNCAPSMRCHARLGAGGHTDASHAVGPGLGATWPAPWPVLAIDHILLPRRSPDVLDAGTLTLPGSDHRARWVRLSR